MKKSQETEMLEDHSNFAGTSKQSQPQLDFELYYTEELFEGRKKR
jgi:hypothetical protein